MMKLKMHLVITVCVWVMIQIVFGSAAQAATIKTVDGNMLGLTGWWTFDGRDVRENVFDRSGNGNNGRLVLFTSTSSAQVLGKIGQAFKFDGVDDYVETTAQASLFSADFTVSLWLYAPSVLTRFFIGNEVGTSNGFSMHSRTTNNRIEMRLDTNASYANVLSSDNSFLSGRWYHVVGTRNGSTAKIYINGVDRTASNSTNSSDASTAGEIQIGKDHNDATLEWNGYIDDVRTYNRALSEKEIINLYNLGSAKTSIVSNTSLTEGLVGWWTFDGQDLIQNVVDKSGNGNVGYMNNFTSTSTAQVLGKIGQALKFDGSNDFIHLGDRLDLRTNDMTVATWVKTNYVTTSQYFISKTYTGAGAYRFGIGTALTSGYIRVLFDGSPSSGYNFNGTRSVTDGQWHHVVVAFDRDGLARMFVDGVFYDDESISAYNGQDFNSAFPFRIGAYTAADQVGVNSVWNGLLDDVRVYHRLLSDSEIKELYNLGGAKVAVSQGDSLSQGLIGWWTFDGKDTIQNITDRSGNGHHGNLQGATTTVMGKIGQGLSFNGTTNFASTTGTVDFTTGSFSYGFWIKSRSGATQDVVSKQSGTATAITPGWGFTISSSAATGFSAHVANGTTYARLDSGTISCRAGNFWCHVFVVVNRTNNLESMYIDGQFLVSTPLFTSGSVSNAYQFVMGARTVDTTRDFIGDLDDVRIYDRALSADEVKRIYNLSK